MFLSGRVDNIINIILCGVLWRQNPETERKVGKFLAAWTRQVANDNITVYWKQKMTKCSLKTLVPELSYERWSKPWMKDSSCVWS